MATLGDPFRKWPRGAGQHRGQLTSAARYPVPSVRTPEEQRRSRRRPVSPDPNRVVGKTATPRSGGLPSQATKVRHHVAASRTRRVVSAQVPLGHRGGASPEGHDRRDTVGVRTLIRSTLLVSISPPTTNRSMRRSVDQITSCTLW
jgi:hypothetical protein